MHKEKESQEGLKHCWNRIGVWGKETPRCSDLKRVTHCRNCEVFIEAGRDLLNREPPEEYLEEWRDVLAEEKKVEIKGTVSVLIFRIGEEWLALPAMIFKEISEIQVVHRIPHRSDEILKGLVNIRGELKLCFNLESLAGIEKKHDTDQNISPMIYKRMVVIEKNGSSWVFPADEIYGVYRYDPDGLQNVPATVSKATATYTKGVFPWREKSVGHLDDELIFYTLNRRIG